MPYSLPISTKLTAAQKAAIAQAHDQNTDTGTNLPELRGKQTDAFGNTLFITPYDRVNIGADQTYSDADARPKTGGVIWYGR